MSDYNLESINDIIGYIAMYQKKDDYGSFLSSFIHTWQTADPMNRKILKESTAKIIQKYDLAKHAQQYKDGTR